MDDLISREALLAAFEAAEEDDIELYGVHISDCFPSERAAEIANKLPAVDAVEVVRCEKCCWYQEEDGGICVNPKCTKSYYGCRVPPRHFCSYGERRAADG